MQRESGGECREWGRKRELKVGAGDYAFVERKFEACSVEDCNNVRCSGKLGPAAGDDWFAVLEDAVSVTEGEPESTAVKDELKENGDGKLDELMLRIGREF